MPILRIVPVAAWLLALGIFTGCGEDALGRHALSGTVKVDGALLPQGNISFQPTEGQPTGSGSRITKGSYSVPKDQGLVAGKYRVSVNAPVPGTGGQPAPDAMPGDPPAPPKELIPPDWNTASKQHIEIKKSGPFNFDFEISTKAK